MAGMTSNAQMSDLQQFEASSQTMLTGRVHQQKLTMNGPP